MKNESENQNSRVGKKVTVRDIADRVGIHFTTVAAALRNSPKVKQSTKDRVSEIAQELGYRTDPMLTALSAYRKRKMGASFQGILAWINGFDSREFFTSTTNGFYHDCYEGALERAERLGYRLESFWTSEPGMTARRASQILESRNVSGVVVGPMPHGVCSLDLLWDKFCSVRIGFSLKDTELTNVISDQFGNMKTVFKKLYDDGFRRIGFSCYRDIDDRTNNQWSGAFCAMQLRYFEKLDIPVHISPDKTSGFLEWYDRHQPEVIVSGCVELHMRELEAANLRVPEDVQVVGVNVDNPSNSHVAGIRQNGSIVGKTSVDNLVAIIHRFDVGMESHPKTVTIPGEWREGQTYTPKRSHDRSPAEKKLPTEPRADGNGVRSVASLHPSVSA